MKFEIRNLKRILPILGIFFCALSALAADVQMSIEPQLISLLDRAVLKVEFINASGNALDIPQVDGLNIQYQGQSSETRIVNMKRTSKVVHTYLVTPSKVGDFTIGPVTAQYKGGQKELTAQLRVIKPSDDKKAQEISELMYSEISTDRHAPHVQEPFELTLKVFIRDGVQIDGNFAIRGGMPENGMDGDLAWNVIDQTREEVNGSIFKVYTLAATARTLTAGTFTFQPQVQMNVIIPRQERRSYGFDDPFFGDFFGRQETRPFVLDCNKLQVNVQPVPMAGRPDSFTGGVGIFDFDVSIGPNKVKAGEPITIKMRIAGNGNLTQITPPKIQENHAFKLYDARTVATDKPNEILFEQVLIPKSDSVTNVPPISFSYFNTKTTDFRTITRGPFPVTVEAAPQQAAQVIATVPSTIQQETKILGRDIVYLKPAPEHWKTAADRTWYEQPLFRVLLALPLLLLLLIAGGTARHNQLAGNVALARRQKAPKAARRHVQLAEQARRKKDEKAFYEALWNALAEYFGHRLNLAPGEVALPAVRTAFPKQQESIDHLFNTIEQRRYGFTAEAPLAPDEMKALLNELTSTLKKCERVRL
ncbi:BatD family protein [Pontiellaceae bacterium B12219]|nr:BatD family protein [Pontiellaceae bacterium B12219]